MSKEKKKPTRAWLTTQGTLLAVKQSLIKELARVGAAEATVSYEGSGDEGQIEEVDATNAKGEHLSLETTVSVLGYKHDGYDKVTYDSNIITQPAEERKLRDVLEDFAYLAIDAAGHAGWENGDGANGDLVIDVKKGTAHLKHNARYDAYETTETES